MTFYARMQALADRQIAAKGASHTVRGQPTAGDPVTGSGGADGASRTITAAEVGIDYRTFPETIVQAGDKMLISSDSIEVGEKWVNGSDEWTVVRVIKVKPDNSTGILWKALVRG